MRASSSWVGGAGKSTFAAPDDRRASRATQTSACPAPPAWPTGFLRAL